MRKPVSKKSEGFWQRWREELTSEQFSAFESAQLRPLAKVIRVNTLRNSISEFLTWVKHEHADWQLTPHPFGEGIFFIDRQDRNRPLGLTLGHAMGRFYIQEASSCLPAFALGVKPGQSVLDMTAAPGSKTTQIAALMKGKGLLVANEISASRIKKLAFNLIRCGVPNVAVAAIDGRKWGEIAPNFFDRVLLDAPCSSEGTLRKKSGVIDFWSPAKAEEFSVLQAELLRSAFLALRPGGTLVYSTCTLAPEENERVISRFLEENYELTELIDLRTLFEGAKKASGLTHFRGDSFIGTEKTLRVWPHLFDSEGFFVAALRKKDTHHSNDRQTKHRGKHPSVLLPSAAEQQKIEEVLRQNFGFQLPSELQIVKRLGENERIDFWLIPTRGLELLSSVSLQRPGIRMLQSHGNKMAFEHDISSAFGKTFTGDRVFELTQAEAKTYLRKHDLPLPERFLLKSGQVLLTYQQIPIGLAKIVGNKLKNSLPIAFAGEYF